MFILPHFNGFREYKAELILSICLFYENSNQLELN